MATNPFITRFTTGRTYRLHTSPALKNFRGGTIYVMAELHYRDLWGNRVLLVDAHLDPVGDYPATNILGARCFVEEGYAEIVGAYGARTVPVEVATVQGVYPFTAKAYANAEVQKPTGGFSTIHTNRVA